MFGVEWTIHWKVVVPLIENTVNETVIGLVGLFSWYNGLSTTSYWVNDVPLIIHVTGNALALRYPQLMITLLPLQKLIVVFWGGLVIMTRECPHTYSNYTECTYSSYIHTYHKYKNYILGKLLRTRTAT